MRTYASCGRMHAQTNFTSLATPSQVGSGKTALVTLLHEGGHAAHFANIDQRSPFFSQVGGGGGGGTAMSDCAPARYITGGVPRSPRTPAAMSACSHLWRSLQHLASHRVRRAAKRRLLRWLHDL